MLCISMPVKITETEFGVTLEVRALKEQVHASNLCEALERLAESLTKATAYKFQSSSFQITSEFGRTILLSTDAERLMERILELDPIVKNKESNERQTRILSGHLKTCPQGET